jgi:hypothetical protein
MNAEECGFFLYPTPHRWEATRGVFICAFCDCKRR